jgi:malonyl-CoA O-methyltransferase
VLCADAEALPLADDSVDLVFSNATLQWVNDLDASFARALRVLRPGGLLMFSSFGPDTLKELRAAWAAVDDGAHVSPFLDMHDVGDALVRARFADPVMDVERMTLTYDHLRDLMRDLKQLGARNASRIGARGAHRAPPSRGPDLGLRARAPRRPAAGHLRGGPWPRLGRRQGAAQFQVEDGGVAIPVSALRGARAAGGSR